MLLGDERDGDRGVDHDGGLRPRSVARDGARQLVGDADVVDDEAAGLIAERPVYAGDGLE